MLDESDALVAPVLACLGSVFQDGSVPVCPAADGGHLADFPDVLDGAPND